MTRLKLLSLGLAAALLFGAGWRARGLVAERDRAEMAAAAEGRDRAALKAEAEAGARALAAREEELSRLAALNSAALGHLKEVCQNDQDIRPWADAPLPDPVLELLR